MASDTEDSEGGRRSTKSRRKIRKRNAGNESFLTSDDDNSRLSSKRSLNDSIDTDDQSNASFVKPQRRQAQDDRRPPLQRLLLHVNKNLQRKDTNGIFAFPVTDHIAPGYSSIIERPMDFSTMSQKIDSLMYTSLSEYKADFELMMSNCMAYNRSETIYHKEALKLLRIGQKYLSKESMQTMRRSLSFISRLTADEIGPLEDSVVATPAREDQQTPVDKCGAEALTYLEGMSKFEAIPDNLTGEEVLEQAKAAASAAADNLTLRAPNSKIGFLRRKDDGTTTFNILNPDNSGIVSEKERVVNLGTLVGKLASGTGNVLRMKEDRRNKANPMHYLNYGSYASFAPVYDSSVSNLTKEDSDLLLSTYCDEVGVQYATSLSRFVADAGDYAISMVDNLLDLLTSGQHSKTTQLLKQKEDEARRQAEELNSIEQATIDVNSSLKDDDDDDKSAVDKQLAQTSRLLHDLQTAQYDRLSQPVPPHLRLIPAPNNHETQLANKVTGSLTNLIKQVKPSDVVSVESVRGALGVTTDTTASSQLTVRQSVNSAEQNNDLANVDFAFEMNELLQ